MKLLLTVMLSCALILTINSAFAGEKDMTAEDCSRLFSSPRIQWHVASIDTGKGEARSWCKTEFTTRTNVIRAYVGYMNPLNGSEWIVRTINKTISDQPGFKSKSDAISWANTNLKPKLEAIN